MENETTAAKAVRGLVKAVFIGCYIAFMWASIHHVAAFFNNFEENSGNTIGSYMLAGAFDITALVTTIGVMFFRKSMPAWVFWIVWSFIVAIACYSFFINWEYASHYQNMALITQPTGETTPVYDAAGVLHYVPVMQVNTSLLWVNPVLASGFTIFSLIYSVIAEFFGTKAATVGELEARKKYLEETESVREAIRQLEGKHKGPSLIQRAKEAVKEAKSAVKEVLESESSDGLETSEEDASPEVIDEEDTDSSRGLDVSANDQDSAQTERENGRLEPSATPLKLQAFASRNGSTSRVYVPIQEVVDMLGYDLQYVKSLRTKGVLKTSRKNSDLISAASIKALLAKKQSTGKRQSESKGIATETQAIHPMINPSEEEDQARDTENEERSETAM